MKTIFASGLFAGKESVDFRTDGLIVDLFAGGGGASVGIENGLGVTVDIAINHDPKAVSLHTVNHPQTLHVVSDVFEVDPRKVTQGRRVALLWASPDCTYHSKARGKAPIRDKFKRRRALAWVVTRWAGQVAPDCIMLENVEEFAKWGPLIGSPDNLRADPKRRGRRFKSFVRSLEQLGYVVESRELRACDYGAPTIRKRLFLIARRDGLPIVWPAPSHGRPDSVEVKKKLLKPYRMTAECIDWSIPICSIFATQEEAAEWAKANGVNRPIRPLKDSSMQRIARGIKRFVIDSAKPFIIDIGPFLAKRAGLILPVTHGNETRRTPPINEPLATITGAARGEQALVSAVLTPRYTEREGQQPRCRSVETPMPTVVPDGNGAQLVAANLVQYHKAKGDDTRATALDEPSTTIDTSNRIGLVASFMSQNHAGFYEGAGRSMTDPLSTVLGTGAVPTIVTAHIQRDFGQSVGHPFDDPIGTITSDRNGHCALVSASIMRDFGTAVGHSLEQPVGAICGDTGHCSLVAAFMAKYFGTGTGQDIEDPLATATTKDRFGLVTVQFEAQTFVITDIGMRMLSPRELFTAQGFPTDYVIDRGAAGEVMTKKDQVLFCGNSVSPVIPAALVKANIRLERRKEKTA